MLTSPSRVTTLLPKNWPRRVRSALVHAISMSNVVFAVTRSHAENHFNARVRLQAEKDRLRREVALLGEELRIKDATMLRIPPQRRPHYPPVERLAILELRAARAWSLAGTARRLLVTPSMGFRRIVRVLARAGLHLGGTTVRRMLRPPARKPEPGSTARERLRVVAAKRPNHVWHGDLTTVLSALGLWLPGSPQALPPARKPTPRIPQPLRARSRTGSTSETSRKGR